MESTLERETIAEIASGESYIVMPPLKGKITILVNCDKEMQVKLTTDDFKLTAQSLFKQFNLTQIFAMLNKGDTLYIDATTCKPLKPKNTGMENPVPSLKSILQYQNKKKNTFNLGW